MATARSTLSVCVCVCVFFRIIGYLIPQFVPTKASVRMSGFGLRFRV